MQKTHTKYRKINITVKSSKNSGKLRNQATKDIQKTKKSCGIPKNTAKTNLIPLCATDAFIKTKKRARNMQLCFAGLFFAF